MHRHRLLTLWVLIATALVNAVVIITLPLNAQPFRSHHARAPEMLFAEERASLDESFGLYLRLRSLAAGRTLAAPEGLLDPMFVDGLADMELEIRDTGGLELVGPTPASTVTGVFLRDDRPSFEYALVPPGRDDRTLVVIRLGPSLVVAPESRVHRP